MESFSYFAWEYPMRLGFFCEIRPPSVGHGPIGPYAAVLGMDEVLGVALRGAGQEFTRFHAVRGFQFLVSEIVLDQGHGLGRLTLRHPLSHEGVNGIKALHASLAGVLI